MRLLDSPAHRRESVSPSQDVPGLGSDGTVSANKNSIKMIDDETDSPFERVPAIG